VPDDQSNRGPSDANRVNVNELWELHYWSKRFGVSPEELKAGVKKVGVMVANVSRELSTSGRK